MTTAKTSKKSTSAGSSGRGQQKAVVKAAPQQLQAIPVESIIKTTQDLMLMGKMASESKFYAGIDTQEKACMVIQTGRELGIMEASACRVIHPIPTQAGPKLAIESKLYAAIGMNAGVRWNVIEKKPAGCTLEFYSIVDKTIPNHIETFTMEDAARANLAQKDNWVWYPEEMCYWRCFLKGVRVFDPRICMGLYSVEEVRDFKKISDGDGGEVYVLPEGAEEVPAAPAETAAEKRGDGPVVDKLPEDFSVLPQGTTDDINKAEDLGEGLVSERREQQQAQPVTPEPPDADDFLPYEEDPTTEELKPGTKDLAPAVPTDPAILIYKQVVMDYMKVQGTDHLYPQFKDWLGVFQTSRDPMKTFVARNQFGHWSLEKGKLEDLKVLTDNIKWTMDMFIDHCFNALKMAKVGMFDNPAMSPDA